MTNILLIKDFDTSLIKFKKSRKTTSGSVIIDLEEMPLLQSPWCTISYPVEHSINIDAKDEFLVKCQEIDNLIVNHCSQIFDFCPQEITEMYKSIIKNYTSESKSVFRTSMNTSTVIFVDSAEHGKTNAAEVLKVGDIVRLLFKIKKITFSNHEIKLQMDLAQVEKHVPSKASDDAPAR